MDRFPPHGQYLPLVSHLSWQVYSFFFEPYPNYHRIWQFWRIMEIDSPPLFVARIADPGNLFRHQRWRLQPSMAAATTDGSRILWRSPHEPGGNPNNFQLLDNLKTSLLVEENVPGVRIFQVAARPC